MDILSEISRELNRTFGDRSGRTVTRRTVHGLKRTTGRNIKVSDAEGIVHLGMVASAAALTSKDPQIKAAGAIGSLLLFGLYQNGR